MSISCLNQWIKNYEMSITQRNKDKISFGTSIDRAFPPSIDRALPTSFDWSYPPPTDTTIPASLDTRHDDARDRDYSIGSWADDYHESFAVETASLTDNTQPEPVPLLDTAEPQPINISSHTSIDTPAASSIDTNPQPSEQPNIMEHQHHQQHIADTSAEPDGEEGRSSQLRKNKIFIRHRSISHLLH